MVGVFLVAVELNRAGIEATCPTLWEMQEEIRRETLDDLDMVDGIILAKLGEIFPWLNKELLGVQAKQHAFLSGCSASGCRWVCVVGKGKTDGPNLEGWGRRIGTGGILP